MRLLLPAFLMASRLFAADMNYNDYVRAYGTTANVQAAAPIGLLGIEKCLAPQNVEGTLVYQCTGKNDSRITIARYDEKIISIFDNPPYGLGKGGDSFALYQKKDGIEGTYVFSFVEGADWTVPKFRVVASWDNVDLAESTRFHFFLRYSCNPSHPTNQKLYLDTAGNWLTTKIIRTALRLRDDEFLQLYHLGPISSEAINLAKENEVVLLQEWSKAARRACPTEQ